MWFDHQIEMFIFVQFERETEKDVEEKYDTKDLSIRNKKTVYVKI